MTHPLGIQSREPRSIELIGLIAASVLCLIPHVAVWDNGGLLPWTRFWICLATGFVAILAVPMVIWRRHLKTTESLALPAIAVLVWGLALAQTVSLPDRLVCWFSPGSFNAFTELVPEETWQAMSVAGDSLPGGQTAGSFPVSVCAWLTRQALFTPAMFGLNVFFAIFLFQRRRALVALMGTTAAAGAIFSFLALIDTVQAVAPGTDPSLIAPQVEYGAPFGSFVNKNSAAFYMNLGLGCTLGLLVYSVAVRRRSLIGDDAYDIPATNKLDAFRVGIERCLRDADATAVALVMIGVLQFVGILASNCRGGFLAALAGVALAVLASQGKGRYLWTAGPLLVATIAVVVLVDHLNLTETTQKRVESIFTLEEGSQVGRIAHWKDGLSAAKNYFPGGSGLGTYSLAYLPYQTSMGDTWFYNADNMFLEWLVEGGVWLLPCVIAGVVFVIRALGRIHAVVGAPHLQGLVAMGWFLLGMTAVSQFFDFGILYPSNLLTLSLMLGAILGADARPYLRRGRHSSKSVIKTANAVSPSQPAFVIKSRRAELSRQFAVAALTIAYLGIGAVTIRWADEGAWEDFEERSFARKNDASSADFDEAVLESVVASDGSYGNAFRHRRGSPMFKLVAANAILAKQVRSASTQSPPGLSADEMQQFRAISKIELRRFLHYEESKKQASPLPGDATLLPGQSVAELKVARRLAWEALAQSPLDVRSRWLLIVTDFLDSDSAELSQKLVDQAVVIWPKSSSVLTRFARLSLPFPGYESASPLFARVLTIWPDRFETLWPYINVASDETAIQRSIPDSAEALLVAIESDRVTDSVRSELQMRARKILDRDDDSLTKARRELLRGRLAMRSKNFPGAIESLAEAVRLDPSSPQVRFLYAGALEANRQIEAAVEQVKRCLVQSPENGQFLEMLRRLTAGG